MGENPPGKTDVIVIKYNFYLSFFPAITKKAPCFFINQLISSITGFVNFGFESIKVIPSSLNQLSISLIEWFYSCTSPYLSAAHALSLPLPNTFSPQLILLPILFQQKIIINPRLILCLNRPYLLKLQIIIILSFFCFKFSFFS